MKDQTKDLHEFLRAAPLEHTTEAVSSRHQASAAGEATTLSSSSDLVVAPIDQNGTPLSFSADWTATGHHEMDDADAAMPVTLNVAATQDQIKATLGGETTAKDEFMKGKFDAAIEQCNYWIFRDPNASAAYVIRARAYVEKGWYTPEDRETLSRLDPRDAYAWELVAQIRAACPENALHDGIEAVAAATKACELTDWNTASHLDTLAASYAASGDFAAAVKWQTKAIELEKDAKKKAEYGTYSSQTGK